MPHEPKRVPARRPRSPITFGRQRPDGEGVECTSSAISLAPPKAVPQDRRPRILLADDYPRLLVALQRSLDGSCDVVGSVSSGFEAIDAAARLRPDVVVLDLTLPDVSGLEACRQIKLAAPEIIIVLLTATDDMDVQASAFRLGASAFVVKHMAAGHLEATILRLFDETQRNS